MREILFRGKRKDNGEWVEGYYSNLGGNRPCILKEHILNGKMARILEYENIIVLPSTVGQYTGLTDKNGRRIFEGDIVICKKEICGNFIDSCVEIGFVEMKHGAFGLHRKQGYYRPFKDWLEDYEYEVIGNIHDNPELLEGHDDNA